MIQHDCIQAVRFVTVFALATALGAAGSAQAGGLRAEAQIKGCENPDIHGTASLVEAHSPEGVKEVTVSIRVNGLSDGKHAVHIHQTAACEPCGAAGGHHDPGPFGQSRPDSATDDVPAPDINHPYHMGDLVNIEVEDGVGEVEHVTNRVTLSPGRLSLFDEDGSSFIIHTYEDTYCDTEDELKKGCAGGPRDACGIIEPVEQ